jgi:hypothetical protein
VQYLWFKAQLNFNFSLDFVSVWAHYIVKYSTCLFLGENLLQTYPNYSYLVVFECVLVVQFYAQIHWSVVQDVELEGLIPAGV